MDQRVDAPLAGLTQYQPHDLRWRIGMVIAALYAVSAAAYLGWRLTVFNTDAPVFSAFFYFSEVYAMLVSFIVVIISWKSTNRRSPPAPGGLDVDVLVTTYNEPVEVVRRTLLGCLRIDYPHQTWLLDDGNRIEMRALARELGCRYLARDKNIDAKAGNLNNALAHCSGAFIALFDADNVPRRDFLDRLLGYFCDPRVAYVQTPQDFYNTNSFQHAPGDGSRLIWNEQSYFHYAKQQGCDGWNAAVLCGSSAIVRRRALDEVGGFATETVTEDIHTGIRMKKLGWHAVYHPVPLAFGIAPTDLDAYLRQRLRWGLGNLQTCREERLPFGRGLTWAQRICYLSLTIQFLDGWQKLVFYLAPAAVLIFGVPPFLSDVGTFCALFVPFVTLQTLLYLTLARGYVRPIAIEVFGMARFATYCLSTLGLFRKRVRFGVSSKNLIGRVNWWQLTPPLSVFTLTGIGLAVYGTRTVYGLETGLTPDVAVIVCFWAIAILAFAAAVVRLAVKATRNREQNFSFEVPISVEFQVGPQTIAASTVRISLDRMSVRLPAYTRLDRDGIVQGLLHFPNERIRFSSEVEYRPPDDTGLRLDCRFVFTTPAERDPLDIALHASAWYRPLVGQHEAAPNVVDWLIRLITRSRPPPVPRLEPVLWRPATESSGPWSGGYFATAGRGRALLFERLPARTPIEVWPAATASPLKQHMLTPAGADSPDGFAEEGAMVAYEVVDNPAPYPARMTRGPSPVLADAVPLPQP